MLGQVRRTLLVIAIILCAAWVVVSILTFTGALDARWMNLFAGAAMLSLLAVLGPKWATRRQN